MRFVPELRLRLAAALVAAVSAVAAAEPAVPAFGSTCHITVVSDRVPDLSSLAAWKKAFITDGMSDQEKALAIWKTVAAFQYQDGGCPCEFLTEGGPVHDPIKMFNVYGYGICSYASAQVENLARSVGLEARGWSINCHSVCEIRYGGAWHLIDASLVTVFPKADGTLASVDEITAGVQAWYARHPECFDGKHGIDDRLRAFEFKNADPSAWRTQGPDVLSRGPTLGATGWYPAGTHGWYSTMQEYDGTGGGADGTSFVYEYGGVVGYELNIQLRPGERLVRNWSNTGLHVNMDRSKPPPECASKDCGFLKKAEAWMAAFDPKLAPNCNGRVGNGTTEYVVPLADGGFRGSALAAENLATTADDHRAPALHVRDAAAPGVLVLRMPSSYVYLTGTIAATVTVPDGGGIAIELSDNHGLDWKPVATLARSGEQTIDLGHFVLRRYDYRLRFTLTGAGTGIDALAIRHDIQESQRALPALGQGDNHIAFSAGAQESTISIQANSLLGEHQGLQVEYTDFHPQLDGLTPDRLRVLDDVREGSLTVPVAVPGEMTRLRIGAQYRTWGDTDRWEFQVSFDGGKTFTKAGDGPAQKFGRTASCVFDRVPPGTKQALVRYVGKRDTANMLWVFRIDADYRHPGFAFRPVQVTYRWSEDGVEKQDVHVARRADEDYVIACATRPVMESIALELAK